METRTGRCLCGAVRIRTEGDLRGVVFCHCSQCRRQTGLHYAATSVPDDRLRIEGAENVGWYSASSEARRGFCRICGSALFWKPEGEARTSVMAGLFDEPGGLAGACHIFVADKPGFYEIGDDLPRFAGASSQD